MWLVLLAGALTAQVLPRAPIDPHVVDMSRRVFEITGASPRECGRFPRRDLTVRHAGATRDELEGAVRCARQAMRDRQPFWTFVEQPGIDSWVAHGLLRTASGDVRWFEYDSDPCGGPGCKSDLSLHPCREVAVTPEADEPDFTCRG